jgi:hypothetical protein
MISYGVMGGEHAQRDRPVVFAGYGSASECENLIAAVTREARQAPRDHRVCTENSNPNSDSEARRGLGVNESFRPDESDEKSGKRKLSERPSTHYR